ncbi:MAG: 50S ribosomal protein L17 [Bacteroidota bacterium]
MRHGKKFNHLGRKSAHRKATLSNMAVALITEKRIFTTVAKAKALRKYVEPLLTKGKTDTMHSRRVVFSKLQDKEAVTELFNEIGKKIAERNGGYTRIIKTGARRGDAAEMCMMELVDYNELLLNEDKKGTRRSRRRKKKSTETEAAVAEEPVTFVAEETTEASEETTEETNSTEEESSEEGEEKKDEA